MSYVVALEGLSAYRSVEDIPAGILTAASRAINRTAERTRTAGRREIQRQVALPAKYLSDNLTIGRPAAKDSLEREIVGRFRPTSLARFARGGTPESTRAEGLVRLRVNPGRSSEIQRAFLIRLRGTGGDTGVNANLGLAIRLREGETLRNRRLAVTQRNGLTLLYGPSIDQTFRSVREDIAPDAALFLEQEFLRLVELSSRG